MPHRPKKRNWALLIGSTLILTTLAVPIARLALPPLHRHLQLNKLTSSDAAQRAIGQTYLIRRAAADPAVVEGAIERLSAPDDRVFLELVITLDQLGYWTRERIPLDPWLRWLSLVAKDPDIEERVRITQLLADMPEHAADGRVQNLFRTFFSDPAPEVRYNAMVCAAEMRSAVLSSASGSTPGAASAAKQYESFISNLTGDPTPLLARHAWLFLGLMNAAGDLNLTPQHLAQPDVAEAFLWVAMNTTGDSLQAITQALTAADTSPRARAMAAYALGLRPVPAARDALIAFLDQGPRAVTDDNQIAFWRAILSLPLAPRQGEIATGKAPPPTDDPGYAALVRFLAKCKREDYENVNLRPLILACLFRDRWLLIDAAIKQSDIVTIADDPVAWLACAEGVPLAYAEKRGPLSSLGPPADVHEQIHLAIVRSMAAPMPADFIPLFTSEKSTIRDQAVLLASQRLPSEQIGELVRTLMKPLDLKGNPSAPVYRYNDGAKQAAAMLIGITGIEQPLLERMSRDFADRPAIHEVIQLALWLRGLPVQGVPDMKLRAEQMLMRDDLPASTVLFALLHRKDPVALERLLTPRGDQNPRLLQLLDEERWWFILEHYLPAGAPRLWVWADNDLARFQLDLLRDWYVVHRHELRTK